MYGIFCLTHSERERQRIRTAPRGKPRRAQSMHGGRGSRARRRTPWWWGRSPYPSWPRSSSLILSSSTALPTRVCAVLFVPLCFHLTLLSCSLLEVCPNEPVFPLTFRCACVSFSSSTHVMATSLLRSPRGRSPLRASPLSSGALYCLAIELHILLHNYTLTRFHSPTLIVFSAVHGHGVGGQRGGHPGEPGRARENAPVLGAGRLQQVGCVFEGAPCGCGGGREEKGVLDDCAFVAP